MYKILFIILTIALQSCTDDLPSAYEYGYSYTDTTPMGIMYRVDAGGAALDAGKIDYYFSAVSGCVGKNFPARSLLIVSTTKDANPFSADIVEGWAWQSVPPHLPALVIINIVSAPRLAYPLLSHEFVHILEKMDSHSAESFVRCGWRSY